MKRKATLAVALALGAFFSSACMTGPSYLSKSVGDMHNKNYKEQPVFTGLMTDVLPVYPVLTVLAWIPDVLILNPVQFWGFDVWEGEGAPHKHKNPAGGEEPWFK